MSTDRAACPGERDRGRQAVRAVDGETRAVGDDHIIGKEMQHQRHLVSAGESERETDIRAAMVAK